MYGNWKTTLRWQKVKLFCIELTILDLNSNDFLPINVSRHTNSSLGARANTFLSIKKIFKNLLIQTSIKLQQ